MDGLCQLPQSARLDRVFPPLEAYYCALRNSRLARETSSRESLRFCADLIQVFCVDYSFVLAANLVRRVHCSRIRQHGRIRAARPARGRLFADVMKITGHDMPTG